MRCHFVFAGPLQLVHCDTCSTQVKPRRSEVSRYLVSSEKYAVHGFTVMPVLNMRHSQRTSCTGPVKTKWQRSLSSESDEYHYEFGVIKFYFTSHVILKITKSEEYCNFTGFFLHKVIFGAIGDFRDSTYSCRQNRIYVDMSYYLKIAVLSTESLSTTALVVTMMMLSL